MCDACHGSGRGCPPHHAPRARLCPARERGVARWAGIALVAAAQLLLPRSATATPDSFGLSYHAPDTCPDREEFLREVSRRLRPRLRAGREERFVDLLVVVVPLPRGYRASLRSVGSDDVARTLEADTCAELIQGMALVTALAVEALSRPRAGAADQPPADETLERDEGSRAQPPDADGELTAPGTTPAFLVDGVMASGVAPALAPGLRAGVALLERDEGLGARVGVEVVRSPYLGVQGALARFTLFAARVEVWPAQLPLVGVLSLVPTVGLEAGALMAEGGANPPRVVETRRVVRPWAALVAAPRLQLGLGALVAEAGPELRVLLVRHEFRFSNPDATVHEIPALAWGAYAGLGAKFE